jgi:hypothetical protein
MLVASMVFWNFGADLVNDFRLMVYARSTTGEVFDSFEDVQEGDDGRDDWFFSVAYRFKHPDGRVIQGSSGAGTRLPAQFADARQRPVPVDIEYLPNDPAINRLKGIGRRSIGNWFVRIGGLCVLIVLLALPGVRLVLDGISEWRAASIQSTADDSQRRELVGPTDWRPTERDE